MITKHTVVAVVKLYNKMFAEYYPPCIRIPNSLLIQTMEVLRRFGRRKVCILFRFILSEIQLNGVNKIPFFSFMDLMTFFPSLLCRAYRCGKERR